MIRKQKQKQNQEKWTFVPGEETEHKKRLNFIKAEISNESNPEIVQHLLKLAEMWRVERHLDTRKEEQGLPALDTEPLKVGISQIKSALRIYELNGSARIDSVFWRVCDGLGDILQHMIGTGEHDSPSRGTGKGYKIEMNDERFAEAIKARSTQARSRCFICASKEKRGAPLFEMRYGLSYVWLGDQEFEDARIVHDGDCFRSFDNNLRPKGVALLSRSLPEKERHE